MSKNSKYVALAVLSVLILVAAILCSVLIPDQSETTATTSPVEAIKNEKRGEAFEEANFQKTLSALSSQKLDVESLPFENTFEKLQYGDNTILTLQKKEKYKSIIVYLHGGYGVKEISNEQLLFADKLASKTKAKIVIPLYTLAPKGTNQDVYSLLSTLYANLLEDQVTISFIGDELGANLALGFSQYLASLDYEAPKGLVLISPWLDLSLSNKEIASYEKTDTINALYGLKECGKLWAGKTNPADASVSAMNGSLKNLPPTLIYVSKEEVFYPDAHALYGKMIDANLSVSIIEAENVYSGYVLNQELPESQKALKEMTTVLK